MVKVNTIYNLHVLEGLKKLPDQSIDMVMTSPPYWNLRDYGKHTDAIWGGDPKCKHSFGSKITFKKTNGESKTAQVQNNKEIRAFTYSSKFCHKCGAWKGQLGLEPTVDLFIEHLMEIFNEVHRVLKKTGTCWVNFGDTYYTTSCKSYQRNVNNSRKLPQKSLSLIPFRFALEMVDKGWILRNIIIWHKPNCLPSPVNDRFTVDFEYLFFFSKSKKYYFDKQLEPLQESSIKRSLYSHTSHPTNPYKKQCDGENMSKFINLQGRNKRCVWKISSRPFKEAHFAVFPELLCEIPIKAGCPEKVCKKCGMPKLQRIDGGNPVAFNYRIRDVKNGKIKHIDRKASAKELASILKGKYTSGLKVKTILGCQCNAGNNAGIVLDPFMGSGTTAVVAKNLSKNFIGFELNPEYVRIAKKRLKDMDNVKKAKL